MGSCWNSRLICLNLKLFFKNFNCDVLFERTNFAVFFLCTFNIFEFKLFLNISYKIIIKYLSRKGENMKIVSSKNIMGNPHRIKHEIKVDRVRGLNAERSASAPSSVYATASTVLSESVQKIRYRGHKLRAFNPERVGG